MYVNEIYFDDLNLEYPILFKKIFLGSCQVISLHLRGFLIENSKSAIANPISSLSRKPIQRRLKDVY